MPLFTPLKRLSLSTSIGDGLTSRTDDVVATRKALKKIGYAAGEEERGYIDRDLDSSIRTYQKDNNLKEDGILHPGGPTERALNISLFDAAEGDAGDEQAPDTPPEEETPAPPPPPEKPEQELATAKTQLADLETRLAKKKEQRGASAEDGKNALGLGGTLAGSYFGGVMGGTRGGMLGEKVGEIGFPFIAEQIDNHTDAESVEELTNLKVEIQEKISGLESQIPNLKNEVNAAQISYNTAEENYEECLRSR
jgi:hypothetical protein